ncbi:MaoC family dehydratase [Flavisphingomonas formosensis]|uniref:MaoC family dehydratase n=1 Tax=Flavisphingomonas formosensis TaxID=861534 RepID=UPI001E65B992|nr:MaoC family dehydratase [Sphingomonas formosensis]
MTIYLEDIEVGQTFSFGSYPVTREEVLEFASRYDPQAFHLDDEAAADNPIFGRLAASGWHTAAMVMRLTVDYWQEIGLTTLGASGVDELRWLKPVYPGDELRAEAEVLARRVSSRADRGVVTFRTTAFNNHDEPVMTQVANVFIPARPTESA